MTKETQQSVNLKDFFEQVRIAVMDEFIANYSAENTVLKVNLLNGQSFKITVEEA